MSFTLKPRLYNALPRKILVVETGACLGTVILNKKDVVLT